MYMHMCMCAPSLSAYLPRYNDFELGAAEHKLPLLYVIAPDWLLQRNPRWQEGLAANQRRLVTARDCLHALHTTVHTLTSPYTPSHPLAHPYVPSPALTGVRHLQDDARAARVARRVTRRRDALAT